MDKPPLSRCPLVVANWKMNGSQQRVEDYRAFLHKSVKLKGHIELMVCPPHTHLQAMGAILPEHWKLGAQDCHWAQQGAYTGEVSASMLKEFGCEGVIIGHSERRQLMGETDEYVAEKLMTACESKLRVILCIGETLAQYNAHETYATLATQLYNCLPKNAPDSEIIIAYEPVWAIGSGRTPSPDDVQSCHDHIRTFLTTHWNPTQAEAIRIIYGGSVNPKNISSFMTLNDVDGVLVGGASLDTEVFELMLSHVSEQI